MKKQRILSALLALCIVFTLVPTALAAKADDFTDVSRSDWFYDYVDYVSSKGYFRGTTETTFSPQRNMTRAMFVVVLFRFDGAKGDSSQSAFTDVAPGAWCTDAINWAAANKIVEGKGDGTFAPDAPITRAQMCAIIDRYLNYYKKGNKVTLPQTGSVSAMSDQNTVPSYAVDAIKQSQRYGLINGFKDGTFRPNALSTRAHVAAVIYRMADLVKRAKAENTSGGGGGGSSSTTYTYTLTYDANGGVLTGAPSATETTKKTSYTFKVTDAIPTRDGYTFLGWAKDKNATTATFFAGNDYTMTSANTSETLYAVWQKAHDPDDLLGNAVLASIDQANKRFTKMKSAVISAVDKVNSENHYLTDDQLLKVKDAVKAMVKIDDVKLEFPSDDMAPRQVIWNVALNVKEGQAVSVIDQASKIANALVSGSAPSKPTPEDIDSFLASVKAAVEKETGIVLTNQSLREIKTQVVNKLKNEGKSLWVPFHDGNGNYVCGDVRVDFNGKPYATIKVGDGNTTLEGSKSQIAKDLSTAIAHEIYKQLKDQGTNGYTSQLKFTIGVNMNFAPSANPEIAAKTAKYANDYQVTVVVNLDSDGLLEYKYDDGNYLCLNITKDIQTAYNNGLQKIAEQFTYNDGTKNKVVAKAKEGIKTEFPALYDEVQNALAKYNITLSTTEQDLEDALMSVVESWVKTNWPKIVDTTISGGTLKGLDNTALINAVWPLIEKDIAALDVDALIQDQIRAKLTEKGIDQAWIVNEANKNAKLQEFKLLLATNHGATIVPSHIKLDIQSINDINAILAENKVEVVDSKGEFLAGFSKAFIKGQIVNMAKTKLDSALTSSPTLKDLLAKDSDLEDYLIYSALVRLGLDFDVEKDGKAAALDSLKPTIEKEGKAKLEAELKAKLSAIDVSAILKDGSAESADAQKKIDLLKSLKFDANGIQTKTAKDLAAALRSPTMMNIVGDKGNKYVDQYLEKIVNKVQTLLPDSASVTLNSVTLDENDLDAFRSAKTTKDAVIALANLIEKFDNLSINSFADPAGQVMTVSCKGRTASAHLVIDVQ
nr:S-layer homology domain-containing protein [uncultured Dysosmobacter sp.]